MSGRADAVVGVIGAGAVGQAVAAALVTAGPQGPAGRVLVASRTEEQAGALAADLEDMRQGLGSPVRAEARPVSGLLRCDAVVIAARAAFTNPRSSDIRMGGAAANAPMLRDLALKLRGYGGLVLVVTNPVDLMTRLVAETSGCARVFGIGSNLDSSRFRTVLARHLDVAPNAVRGHVIGEHGDGAVVCASTTTVNGRPAPVPLDLVREELRARPGRISAGIGRTRCGPAGAVVSTLAKGLGLRDGTEELSTVHGGDWLGIPLTFHAGRPIASLPDLNAAEQQQFAAAASRLRTAYAALRPSTIPSTERTA
ncbi:lactate/malate family dehydrogenase [Streptomyces xiamenensis]|uniref:lactate/malate family dehydrogenase n=1 Tax=Streptomyces xiamenensis TaxID=408015 RepID=UPI0035D57455